MNTRLTSIQDVGSLKDRVYDTLKMEIILGRFKAGETLNMLELSNTMNISSAPVREALNMLSQDGFVVLSPRKKATVSEPSPQDFQVVIELRLMLEPYAAKMSCGRIPGDRIQAVRRQLTDVLEQPTDMKAYVQSDLAMHEIMHCYAGSAVLSDILTTVKEHSMRMRYSAENLTEENKEKFILSATREHLSILDALEQGDPEAVYSCVRDHLDQHYNRTKHHTHILDSLIRSEHAARK